MISLKRNRMPRWASGTLIERQTNALEAIATHLTAIEAKLDRVANALERNANLSANPF